MASFSSISGIGFINTEKCSLNSERDNLLFGFNGFRFKRFEQVQHRRRKTCLSRNVRAINVANPDVDFTNPDWKKQFQQDFEDRFSLPHLIDIFDINPRPTTFSLNCRGPQVVNGIPSMPGERRNGYVNDDDRALLKVIKFSSPTSAGAECIDPDCSWVEQWYATPFGLTSEYAHPAEILFLGFATIVGPAITGPHLFTLWLWMTLRVLETVEAHCGYHLPWSLSNLFPLYGGAHFHDYHHRLLFTKSGNYS